MRKGETEHRETAEAFQIPMRGNETWRVGWFHGSL